MALAGTGDVNAAIGHFDEAARLRPDVAVVHAKLAELLLQTGQSQKSLEHLAAAIRLDPNYVAAYFTQAQALSKLNRSQEAVSAAQRGINVARAAGREVEAKQIEDWLQQNPAAPQSTSP